LPVTVDWSQTVAFEIPDLAAAVRLTRKLGRTWEAGLLVEDVEPRDDEPSVVLTQLRDWETDLAVLLREVEAWIKEESALAIRFCLDGRTYVLQAGEADWDETPLTETDPRIAPTG
jgi:hypothetical protein